MKKKILAVSFLLFIACCGIAFSEETCYSVEGTVDTINLSEEVQQGIIWLRLFDEDGDVFNETGDIVGIVIESSPMGKTYLIHTATFKDKSKFVTYRDEAVLYPLALGEDGSPCEFEVSEQITNIVKGKGFFKNVSSVAVEADGDIDTCGDNNKNGFYLTGEICFK